MSDNALVLAARQIGAKVLPDTNGYINRVEIRSQTSDKLYTVSQRRSDGVLCCSCFGWVRHRHCKHTDAFNRALIAAERAREVR